jgi:hypothetical protein
MKPLLTTLLLLAGHTFSSAQANDPISIKLNKLNFSPGDTLAFSCNIANYKTLGLESATLNLWIEDVNRTKTWKFRYPVMNGQLAKTRLAIPDSLKPGVYAINFIIQKGLFSVYGKVRDTKLPSLKYFILTNDRKSHSDTLHLSKEGRFALENVVFDNEASFLFSPVKSKTGNELFIGVVTPLDSMFVPEAVLTQLITVGITDHQQVNDVAYEFQWDEAILKGTLPNVTVTAKQKKKGQLFNEEYTSPFFRQDDNQARWFDGFEDPQLSKTANLENFLLSRVPNFRKETDYNEHTITYYLRGDVAHVFLNEMPVPTEFDINTINPSEIALIKVINSPTMINRMGDGAAILIYLKRGNYYSDPNMKHNFVFKGYTPQVSSW